MALARNEQMNREILQLRNDLKTYRPGTEAKGVHDLNEVQFPEHLYIGLFGRTGCGKTSLFNSLKFAVSGDIRVGDRLPVAHLEKAGGHTLIRVTASLEDNISVIDNRGVDDLTKEGILKELKAQLDGRRGYREEVDWENPQNDDFVDAESGKYSIGSAVFVFSAQDTFSQSTHGLHKIVHFVQEQQGQYPVAVITKVDCDENVQRVDALRANLQVTGISEIFEVANVTKNKTKLEASYRRSLLSLLDRCMTDSDAYAVLKQNRQKEQREREEKRQREEEQRREEEQKMIKEYIRMGEQEREEQQKWEEKRRRNIQEQNFQELEEKMNYLARSVGIAGSTTATGALIGLALGGPIGSAIGAGVGGAIGGTSFMFEQILA